MYIFITEVVLAHGARACYNNLVETTSLDEKFGRKRQGKDRDA